MAVNLTKEKPADKSENISEANVLNLLYTQVVKPENIIKESVFNVYGDRYRINLWTEVYHAFIPKAGTITKSYFCQVNSKGLTILS